MRLGPHPPQSGAQQQCPYTHAPSTGSATRTCSTVSPDLAGIPLGFPIGGHGGPARFDRKSQGALLLAPRQRAFALWTPKRGRSAWALCVAGFCPPYEGDRGGIILPGGGRGRRSLPIALRKQNTMLRHRTKSAWIGPVKKQKLRVGWMLGRNQGALPLGPGQGKKCNTRPSGPNNASGAGSCTLLAPCFSLNLPRVHPVHRVIHAVAVPVIIPARPWGRGR